MSIRQRITFTLIAIGFVPLVLVFLLFLYSLNQMSQVAITDSRTALEQVGEQTIRDKAETVARAVSIYIKSNPQLDPADYKSLQTNQDLISLAVQPIGQTGYTAIHDSKGVSHFHNNPALVGTYLGDLADRLPEFWRLAEQSLDGTVTEGYYDWLEPDGVTIRQKYMVIVPVEGTDLRVAATTYIDEFSAPAQTLTADLTAVTNRSILITILISLGIAVLVAFIATLFGQRFTNPIESLTNAAEQIQQGSFDARVVIQSQDEIGRLAAAFNSMASQLRESIMTLEQRVAERTRALTTVSEISTAASTILDIHILLREVVNLSKERFGLYHSHIYWLDEAGENLVLVSGAGEVGQQMVAQGHSIPLSRERSLVARAARERKGVTVNDVTQEPDFLPNPLLPDTHAELAVPMLVGSELIGVFDIQSEQVGRFTESDIAVQTTLAAQIASAIQNARSYTEVQRSQALLSDALKVARIGNWEYDLEKDLFTFNDHFYSIFRTNVQEVGSYQISSAEYARRFVHPEDAPLVGKEIQRTLESKERHFEANLEHRIIFPDGEIGYIAVNITVERDENGQILRWYGANQDITERRRAEELNKKRAWLQEALNTITQKIQNADTVEAALQVTARELGHALGKKQTLVALQTNVERKEN